MRGPQDDDSMQELGEEVEGQAYFVQEKCQEAIECLDFHYTISNEAKRGLSEIRDAVDILQNATTRLESGVGDMDERAENAYMEVEEANSVAGRIGSFGVEIANRARDGDPSTAETEIELGGVRYRVRFDPLEEVETEDIDE